MPIRMYYDGRPRPTGEVLLVGAGHSGRGENVDWTPQDQEVFAAVCADIVPRLASLGRPTIGELSERLLEIEAHPHHRAAIEAAALELALRQASTDLFRLAGRPRRRTRFCWSIGRETVDRVGPEAAVEALLTRRPAARIKIDGPSTGWPEATWKTLSARGRIVAVDFKRDGEAGQVALAHRHLPDTWLEDPPVAAWKTWVSDQPPAWLGRVALDGYVLGVPDLHDPPIPPAAINVKAPRVGGWLEALRCLERCGREGWHAYIGGMFEVGVGRRQARALASLFTAEAWNDLAPLGPS
ncbi:MAG: hypothetical protein ACREK7_08350 [Gemmatimonadota bacterium]